MDNGVPYKIQRHQDIIEEQVLIGYLSKGAINLENTDMVSPYERKLILNAILKIKEQENKAQEDAMHR